MGCILFCDSLHIHNLHLLNEISLENLNTTLDPRYLLDVHSLLDRETDDCFISITGLWQTSNVYFSEWEKPFNDWTSGADQHNMQASCGNGPENSGADLLKSTNAMLKFCDRWLSFWCYVRLWWSWFLGEFWLSLWFRWYCRLTVSSSQKLIKFRKFCTCLVVIWHVNKTCINNAHNRCLCALRKFYV